MGQEGDMSPEISGQPEAPRQNPTEASRGFLSKIAHGAKEGAIALAAVSVPGGVIAYSLRREMLAREQEMARAGPTAKPEVQPEPESAKPTPTEASDAFLRDKKFNPLNDIASSIRIMALPWAGYIGYEIAKGNYKAAAVSGIILGAGYAPEIIRVVKKK